MHTQARVQLVADAHAHAGACTRMHTQARVQLVADARGRVSATFYDVLDEQAAGGRLAQRHVTLNVPPSHQLAPLNGMRLNRLLSMLQRRGEYESGEVHTQSGTLGACIEQEH